MLCQECHQNPASLHFTKIINGEKTEIHLCELCAKEMGDYVPGSNSFSIHQLLSGLLNTSASQNQGMINGEQGMHKHTLKGDLTCPTCQMTYSQFAEIGRFGCADCYRTFDQKLDPVFRRIHGGNAVHNGKVPARLGEDLHVRREIEQLRELLRDHIHNEAFEEAAKTRDEIRGLEENLQQKGGKRDDS